MASEAESGRDTDIVHGAMRGAIAAMAMSGMRVVTTRLGIVDETPPQSIFGRRARGLLKRVPRAKRPAAIELAHWTYGALGGAIFGALPRGIREARWSGPVYGLGLWAGFGAGIAPVLGLPQFKRPQMSEQAGLIADHLLYGLVLSETRSRPRG